MKRILARIGRRLIARLRRRPTRPPEVPRRRGGVPFPTLPPMEL